MLTQRLSVYSEVRECLKLDPDHKQCFSHYKQVKKLNKQILSAEELIQHQRCVLHANYKHKTNHDGKESYNNVTYTSKFISYHI